MKYLEGITDAGMRDTAIQTIADGWASHDPLAALNWARSLPDTPAARRAARNSLRKLAVQTPQAALGLLSASSSAMSAAERTAILDTFAEKHPALARQFIESGGLRADMQREAHELGRRLGKTYDEVAMLGAKISPGAARDAYLSTAADRLDDGGDFTGSWKAIATISPGIERHDAMVNHTVSRAQKSITDTTTWLSTFPSGEDRDAAIYGFAIVAEDTNRQLATEWAAAITDPADRWSLLQRQMKAWRRENSKAASTWITNTPILSAVEKSALTISATSHQP